MSTLPVADRATVRREATALLRGHRRSVVGLLVLHTTSVLAALVAPWLIGVLVEGVVSGAGVRHVDVLAALVAVAVLVQAGFVWLSGRASFVFGENVFSDLRETFADRLLALPPTTVERAGTGEVVSRTTRDVDAVADFVRTGLPEVVVGLLSVVFTVAAAFVVDPVLALTCLVGLPVIAVSTRWFTRRARAAFATELAANAAVTSAVVETVHGARSVDALGIGDVRAKVVSEAVAAADAAERVPLRLRTRWFPLVQVGYQLPLLSVLLVGGLLVAAGRADLGGLTTVTLYIRMLIVPLNDLVYWYGEAQLAMAAFARIVGVGQVPPDRVPTGAVPDGERIGVEGVSYAYYEGHDVLRSVTLDIRPGERLAVVGPSGAGKSTLGLLLAGIYVARAGRVSLGGVDLADIPREELRSHVTLVTQEDHVFTGSLADNLRLGREDATDDELTAALVTVGADDWLRGLPDGLATRVGADGLTPSAAVSQQIALARVVVKNPHTVVLDEATSTLSPGSARRLETALSRALEGRTVVTIAHRLRSAHDADRVVVMGDGEILEVGSHDDLVRRNGPYAALWSSWSTAD